MVTKHKRSARHSLSKGGKALLTPARTKFGRALERYIVRRGYFSLREAAKDMHVGYYTLLAWRRGDRHPHPFTRETLEEKFNA
jgi:hypothetical protein